MAQRGKGTLLSPTQQVLFKSQAFQFQMLYNPPLPSHGHPWQPCVLEQCPQAGPLLTLDKEDERPHGLSSCIVDFTAIQAFI